MTERRSAGAITPRDMDARQFSEFVQRERAIVNGPIKSFTPDWLGFSVAPTGDLKYLDLDGVVFMWSEVNLLGTSSGNSMSIENLPTQLQPTTDRYVTVNIYDHDRIMPGGAQILAPSAFGTPIIFMSSRVDATVGHTDELSISATNSEASGGKGLTAGTMLIWAK